MCRGVAALILNQGTRCEWSASRSGLLSPGKNPGTHSSRGWVGPRGGGASMCLEMKENPAVRQARRLLPITSALMRTQ